MQSSIVAKGMALAPGTNLGSVVQVPGVSTPEGGGEQDNGPEVVPHSSLNTSSVISNFLQPGAGMGGRPQVTLVVVTYSKST